MWLLSTTNCRTSFVSRRSSHRSQMVDAHVPSPAEKCSMSASTASGNIPAWWLPQVPHFRKRPINVRSWPNPLRPANWPRRRSVALVLMLPEAACLHPQSCCNDEKQLLRLPEMKSKPPNSAKCIAMLPHFRNRSRLFRHGF